MKVIFAYCHELGRSVSIDDARTEFFSRKPEERRRFTFSCSDRNCGITITGVNYHIKAEDGKNSGWHILHLENRTYQNVSGFNSLKILNRINFLMNQSMISRREKQGRN